MAKTNHVGGHEKTLLIIVSVAGIIGIGVGAVLLVKSRYKLDGCVAIVDKNGTVIKSQSDEELYKKVMKNATLLDRINRRRMFEKTMTVVSETFRNMDKEINDGSNN